MYVTGSKLTTCVFLMTLSIAINHVKNSIADQAVPDPDHQHAQVQVRNKKSDEFIPELENLNGCTRGCKLEDMKCVLECFKIIVDGMDKARKKKFLADEKPDLTGILCTAGCGIAKICPEADESPEIIHDCNEACAQYCFDEATSSSDGDKLNDA